MSRDLEALKAMLVEALAKSHDAPWAITRDVGQIGARHDVDRISLNVNGGEYFEHFDADKLAETVLAWADARQAQVAAMWSATYEAQSKRLAEALTPRAPLAVMRDLTDGWGVEAKLKKVATRLDGQDGDPA